MPQDLFRTNYYSLGLVRDGNLINFDISNLLTPQEKVGKNFGAQVPIAKEKLRRLHGIDFDRLPQGDPGLQGKLQQQYYETYIKPKGIRAASPDVTQGTTDISTFLQGKYTSQPVASSQKVGDLIPGGGGLRYEEADIANLSSGSQALSFPLTGDSKYDAVLEQLQNILNKFNQQGQIVNPNIDITPERLSEFLKQAEAEIDPYYSTQLSLARENLLRSAGYNLNEILQNEQELQLKYGKAVRQLGETEAERGFAQSGIRQQGERELALATQQDIATGRRTLDFQTGTLARTFAQQYGQPPPTPSISAAPTVTPGEQTFGRSERTLPLYELSPDVYSSLIGEQEFAHRGAIQSRQLGLEQLERARQGIGQYRQLVI